MGQYRKRLEIIADILSVAKDGAKKTRIMYQANLSYRLLIVYLKFVRDAGLVFIQGKGEYVLSQKGQKFLERYKQYSQRFEQLEMELKDVKKERRILETLYIPNAVDYDWNNSSRKPNRMIDEEDE